MDLGRIFRARSEKIYVWAALCAATADGSDPRYAAPEKHALLVMIRAQGPDVESAIAALLQSNGWMSPTVQNLKRLDEPFCSDDSDMRTCYDGALTKDGGIIVYSDPIQDGQH